MALFSVLTRRGNAGSDWLSDWLSAGRPPLSNTAGNTFSHSVFSMIAAFILLVNEIVSRLTAAKMTND
ncbi:MAG: hypothetical protein ACLSE6_08045 [Alphaproteobacteria bacterium]